MTGRLLTFFSDTLESGDSCWESPHTLPVGVENTAKALASWDSLNQDLMLRGGSCFPSGTSGEERDQHSSRYSPEFLTSEGRKSEL